jgi:predicted CxxxxCH...CXXCH cytochrome family protein
MHTSDRAVGAHQVHLNGGSIRGPVACMECHEIPIGKSPMYHIDRGIADITFGELAKWKDVIPRWDSQLLTCSNTYCHGGTMKDGAHPSPVWTKVDGSQSTCTSCHGAPPPAPHIQVEKDTCHFCHAETVSELGTIRLDQGTHIDGIVQSDARQCMSCHDTTQGFRRPVTGKEGDFGKKFHHVSAVQDRDCKVCHSMDKHTSGDIVLVDPDNKSVTYTYDESRPGSFESFCLNCHDTDGAKAFNGRTPFSDGKQVANIKNGGAWKRSAHSVRGEMFDIGCTSCHDNGHGSDQFRMLTSVGEGQPAIDKLCFNCHTSGLIKNDALSGETLSDNIEDAFAVAHNQRHDMGSEMKLGDKTFRVQCTTCHNPHISTGKHHETGSGKSPVTMPDLEADPKTNPHAVGHTLFGVSENEKMNAYADKGKGTGGWQFNVERGFLFGASELPEDQVARYQPPLAAPCVDGKCSFELKGNKIPDYATFCLSCHGQPGEPPFGIQWDSDFHGLNAAQTPMCWGDECEIPEGHPGAGGNPAKVFSQEGVHQGRGGAHWTKWPYEMVDRVAGINFVLSCTDCHEAHGSSNRSLIRTKISGKDGIETKWTSMCASCHFFEADFHLEMPSCGTSFCHENPSIHRFENSGEKGGVHLWTPPNPPVIQSVTGKAGSKELHVRFSEAVWGFSGGALVPDDFQLVDKDQKRRVQKVKHKPGDKVATIVLSSALNEAGDIEVDTLSGLGYRIVDAEKTPIEANPVLLTAEKQEE